MVLKEEHKLNLPKCKVELHWIADLIYFIAFLLLSLLIPYKLLFHEIGIYIGIGICFAIARRRHTSRWVMPLTIFVLVTVIYIPRMSLIIMNLISELLNFVRFYINTASWVLLGTVIGSIIRAILNYKMCRRGDI